MMMNDFAWNCVWQLNSKICVGYNFGCLSNRSLWLRSRYYMFNEELHVLYQIQNNTFKLFLQRVNY